VTCTAGALGTASTAVTETGIERLVGLATSCGGVDSADQDACSSGGTKDASSGTSTGAVRELMVEVNALLVEVMLFVLPGRSATSGP
jgi:hypothetical protein